MVLSMGQMHGSDGRMIWIRYSFQPLCQVTGCSLSEMWGQWCWPSVNVLFHCLECWKPACNWSFIYWLFQVAFLKELTHENIVCYKEAHRGKILDISDNGLSLRVEFKLMLCWSWRYTVWLSLKIMRHKDKNLTYWLPNKQIIHQGSTS